MVPELDWFDLPGAFDNLRAPSFYNMAPNTTWPRVIDSSKAGSEGCDAESRLYAYRCPGGGFPDIWNWVKGWEISALRNNIKFSEPTGTVRRRIHLSSPVEFAEGGNATYTTTVSMPSMLTIGRLLNYRGYSRVNFGSLSHEPKFKLQTSETSVICQPLVQTRCAAYDREKLEPDNQLAFDYGGLVCFGDTDCERSKAQVPLPIPAVVLDSTDINPVVVLSAPNATESRPLLATISLPYLDLNQTTREREVKV